MDQVLVMGRIRLFAQQISDPQFRRSRRLRFASLVLEK